MEPLTRLAICAVALLHCLFLVLEMFLWRTTAGRRISGLNAEMAVRTSALAANQGLYNGFIAAGLFWSLFASHGTYDLRVFFLTCVVIAGLFGAFTVSRTILIVQAIPGMIALLLVLLG